MLESLSWWISSRRCANFWDWVRETHSDDELERLVMEATDCSLIRPYDSMADSMSVGEEIRRKTVKMLIKRYGNEIWSCCLGAADYAPEDGRVGLGCISKLDLSSQVCSQTTFEEFLVRNALKHVARSLLQEGRKNKR